MNMATVTVTSTSQCKEEAFICDICQKPFANATYLNKHKKQIHFEINKEHQQCPKCPMNFKSLRNFWRHILVVHEGLDGGETTSGSRNDGVMELDSFCGQPTTRRRAQATEQKGEELMEAKCPVCGKQFLATSRLIRHMNNIHLHPGVDSKIKCGRCGKRFQDEETLEEHITEVHEQSIIDMFAFPCNLCQITFTTVDGIWRHKTKVHDLDIKIEISQATTCQYCEKLIYTDYTAHVKEYHGEHTVPPPCDQCGKRFADMKNLKRHVSSVHASERAFSCSICGKNFKDNKTLQKHIPIHRTISLEPNVKAMLKTVFGSVCSKTLTCGICKVVVYSSLEAKIHLYIKHYEIFDEFMKAVPSGIPCPCCSDSFETKELILTHLEVAHSDHEIPICKFCGHKEIKERELNFHYKEFHPEESRYACDLCKITFNRRRDYNFHMKREHGDTAGQCPYCTEKHMRVKMHVTMKHPEKADEYRQLVEDAIRDEAESRLRFNEFLDPGSGKRNPRNAKKKRRDAESEDDDSLDEDLINENEASLMAYNVKPLDENQTEKGILPNYKIEKAVDAPHIIKVRRLEPLKMLEQEENIFGTESDSEQTEIEGIMVDMDIKPSVDELDEIVVDSNATHEICVDPKGYCKPAFVLVTKLTDSEIQKWSNNARNNDEPPTEEKANVTPTYSRRLWPKSKN